MATARIRLLIAAVAVQAAGGTLAPAVSAAPVGSETVKAGLPADIVISRDGLRQGNLSGCAGGSCRLDSVSIARPEIIWIGLKMAVDSLPAPRDPLRDEVHYRDGSVHPGRLVGIDTDQVVTERSRHSRAAVAWIFLTPVASVEDASGPWAVPRKPEDTIISDPPPEEDTEQAGGGPTALPAPGGQPGGLWTGKIESTWIATITEGALRRNSVYEPVRLRERLYPLLVPQGNRLVPAGTVVMLVSEGSITTEQFTSTGVCSAGGSGSATLSESDISGGSGIWKKTVDVDTTPGIGWNVPAGPGWYQLSLAAPEGQTYPIISCNDKFEQLYSPVVIGRYPSDLMNPHPMDPEMRFVQGDGSRMSGTYTAPMSGGQVTVSWDLCRAGSRGCRPAD